MKRTVLILILAACKYPALPPLTGGDDDGGAGSDALPPGSPMIAAVEPAIATVGTTLALEGTFTDPMTVNFPGGVTATATVLGKHRATVVVPTGASSGSLDAMTGGVMTGSVLFRTPSFTPGLASFRTSFPQVDAARMAPALAVARTGAGAAVVGHDLYVIGGKNGTSPVGSVEHALINGDGTVGTFTIDTSVSLVTARSGATTAVLGGYIYVIGGTNAGGPLASVERAKVQADGSLSTFATVSGVTLATARTDAASAVVGDSLYVLGGTGASGKLASIEAAVIDPDSSLEAFTPSSQVLSTARSGAAAVVTASSLYVLGGDTGAGVTGAVEASTLAADGTFGAFAATAGVTLKVPRAYFATAVLGTSVFAIGGTGTNGVDTRLTDVATISTDGTLGNFASAATSGSAADRHAAAVAVARDHVFVLGGNNGTTDLTTVEHSGIATHGAVGAFATLGSEPLSAPRAWGGSVVIGDHLYLVGGADLATLTARRDISTATVQPDGSLGPFSQVNGVTLTADRIGSSLAVLGDYLYVIGGENPNMTTMGVATLERAQFNADGTLGAFQPYTGATLTTGRHLAAAAIIGTNLYVMGGTGNGVQALSVTDQAQVDSSGSISFFFNSGTSGLANAHSNFSAAVFGGYCYVFGGINGTGVSTKVIERAAIQSDGSLGSFSATVGTLSTERALYTEAVVGNDLYLVSGANNVGSPADPGLRNVDHAVIAADGSAGAFSVPAATTLPEGIFFHFGAVLGNFVYVLGGGSHTSTTTPSEVKQALLP